MTIKEKISGRIQEVMKDGSGAVADRISDEAFAALLTGVKSPEWETFMKNFADDQNPDQLLRLTFKDSTATDPMMKKSLVYLAATSMCGAITITLITNYVNVDVLDKTLGCASPAANANPHPDADADGPNT